MLKQHQEQASTSAYCCSHLATQQGTRHMSLEEASSIYKNCRQSWDGRVYYHPALLSSAGTSLRHSKERVNICSPAKCCGCCIQKLSGATDKSMQHSTEELELVSLLQDASDCWSPDGWLPAHQGSRSCRPQRVEGFNHQKPSRKRSNSSMQFNTAGNNLTQPASVVIQQSAARQPTVPAAGILNPVEHVASHVTAQDSHRGLQSQKRGGHVADGDAAIPPAAADLAQGSHTASAAQASQAFVSHDAAAAKAGSALGSLEAAAAKSDLAHDNQEAAADEADAATMAAWLIQKPSLLQGVLGHLESLAATTLDSSRAPTASSNPPPVLLMSSSTESKLSAGGADGVRNGTVSTVLAASVEAGQPLLSITDSAAKQEWSQIHLQAAASTLLTPAEAVSVAFHNHQPQFATSSQHRASADAEVQQPDITGHWSSKSLAGLCGQDQQQTACSSTSEQQQQQSTAQHLSWPFESLEQHQDCSHGANCPDSVQATGRSFREHCAAGRYDEARSMLKGGAMIDTADAEGNTPLMLASRGGHGRLVKLLVRKGAKLAALNADGKTAEQLASHHHHKGVANFLREFYAGSHWQS